MYLILITYLYIFNTHYIIFMNTIFLIVIKKMRNLLFNTLYVWINSYKHQNIEI